MPGQQDADRDRVTLRSRLRLATLIALAAVGFFLPLEHALATAAAASTVVRIYAVHAALAAAVLAATFTRVGNRHLDALALVLTGGFASSLLLYDRLSAHHPALAASALTCLLIASCVLFSWSTRRVFVLAALVTVGFALVGMTAPPDVERAPFVMALASLVVGASVAVVSARLLAEMRASLSARETELATLSANLMSLQEEERRRLSRELHDGLGQSLTAALSYFWLIERQLPEESAELRSRTAEARRLMSSTLAEVRKLSQVLHPSVLDDYGLLPSLDAHVREFAERYGIPTTLTTDGLPERLATEIETAVYRITQEALTNVARHAHATRARVALAVDDGALRLEVADDGRGFPAADGAFRTGMGLIAIRERVRGLGGTLTISSGRGACLHVELPLRAAT